MNPENRSKLPLKWNEVSSILPTEGKVVRAMSPGGQEQLLKRKGALWFLPDGSMYVYYTPVRWADYQS